MQLLSQFSAIATRQRIDADAGIIHGVSVITQGEALGHGLFIDAITLSQVRETAGAYPGGLKVKVNHGKDLESIVGVLKNFAMDGAQLRADLHLLKNAEDRAKIIEMAQTMPESFGLSVAIANEPEEIEGKKYIRCAEIYSADLVDGPAANPGGLFSRGPGGELHKQNEPSANNMSKAIAVALGLADTATDQEIAVALKTALEAIKPPDLSKVTTDLEAVRTQVTELAKARDNALSLAKKSEIDALMAEAARDGKVVPFDADDLYTSKDGVITIKQEPTALAKMIGKLAKNAVALAKKSTMEPPKDANGNALSLSACRDANGNIDRNKIDNLKQWCADRLAAGAEEINAAARSN